VNYIHSSFLYVSLIADFFNTGRLEQWNIVNPIFIAMSASTQRILDCKRSITLPVNYKDVLKIDCTLARLSNANLRRPQRGQLGRRGHPRAARAAWAARRPPARRRLIKLQRILVIALSLT
jgi:hypothetical protein